MEKYIIRSAQENDYCNMVEIYNSNREFCFII